MTQLLNKLTGKDVITTLNFACAINELQRKGEYEKAQMLLGSLWLDWRAKSHKAADGDELLNFFDMYFCTQGDWSKIIEVMTDAIPENIRESVLRDVKEFVAGQLERLQNATPAVGMKTLKIDEPVLSHE